ncbi:sorting nexin-29-like isoform X2 [Aricia agestis]|uniref:sorting nexin-29-like isoform X2 n=1 Tax=Aricia agestis TaxID=91739 RepID=UPI001C20A4C2|nr:sorting nexin-29-like isoform X2 [Aricia agestis]
MNSRILNTIANAIDNKEEVKKRIESGKGVLKELQTCVENCQTRFGGKSELATEDDIRIVHLCEKWEKILSHGLKSNLSNSSIQDIVTAGLNFTFNIINVGNSLWSYSCLHLTKHEKERFKILANINTPLGYFRAFLRAALNERSLVRYIQSWISHGLLGEYYEEGAFVRSPEANILPGIATGLSTVLFALSIDRTELNDSQHSNQMKAELVIPLPTPVKPSGNSRRKPLRQVISFDKDEKNKEMREKRQSLEPIDGSPDCSWNSAPATCLNSPDPKIQPKVASTSEPTSSDSKSGIRHFFPDGVKGIESPLQILSKLSESAKEMFTHSQSSIDKSVHSRDDDLSVNCLKLSESDSEGVAGSIDGSNSCLELCFEDESIPDDKSHLSILEIKEKEFLALQTRCNQIELRSRENILRENDRLKEQLKNYMSAVEMGKALKSSNCEEDEANQYERKLVQVAEMHAELMEFNQHLQKRLQELEGGGLEVLECPQTNVKACIPTAFLVGKKPHTYHVYQIFLKVGLEEWNVYHRYAKFYELHTQLKKCHPDIASYKFPPKKTLRKRDPRVVEQRRVSLQAYLRHVLLTLPELRACTSRTQLVTLLPFFGISSTTRENGLSHSMSHQPISDTYEAL